MVMKYIFRKGDGLEIMYHNRLLEGVDRFFKCNSIALVSKRKEYRIAEGCFCYGLLLCIRE